LFSTGGVTGGVVAVALLAALLVVLAGRDALSDWLPVVVQAVRTADAAASENVRRLKLGVDGFNDFSSNGAGACEGHRVAAIMRTGSPAAIVLRRDRTDDSRRAHIINQSPAAAPSA
jgi:hypothetical protein